MNQCPINFNPYDIQYADDLLNIYKYLRDNEPVYWNDEEKFWLISRYEDVTNLLKDYKTFTNQFGTTPSTRVEYIDSNRNKFYMERKDPPEHNIDRRIVNKIFNKLLTNKFKKTIRENIKNILEKSPNEVEIVSTVFDAYPIQTLAELLGFETDVIDFLRKETKTYFDFSSQDIQKESSIKIAKYLFENPPKNLSMLKEIKIDNKNLSDFDIIRFCIILIISGYETVTHSLSNLLVDLDNNRDQFNLLLTSKNLIPNAVEESLRLRKVAQYVMRTATKDIEIHGKKIKSGDSVVFLNGSANADNSHISHDPDRFIISRDYSFINLTFGYGPHYCPGANLARIQLRFFLEELIENYSNFRILSKEKSSVNNIGAKYWERIDVRLR